MVPVSIWPRIDPDHPLCIAERQLDNEARDEKGIEKLTMRRFGDTLSLGELCYMAEQRALRAGALLMFGEIAFVDEHLAESFARKVIGSAWWHQNRELMMSLYLDGVLVATEAARISPW